MPAKSHLMAALKSLLLDERWQPAWRVLLLVLMAAAAWFAFVPATPTVRLPGADKIDHLLAFAALGLSASFTAPQGLQRAALVAAGLLLYGGFIELVQTQLPSRHGNWEDLLADAVGVAAGVALAALLRRVVVR